MINNGSNRLAYWIMGGMFTVIMALVSGASIALNARVEKLEDARGAVATDVLLIKLDVQRLRRDFCDVQEKLDELREEVSGRRVYRRPCP